jgi:1-acyl-sn-glycerol-3-phosphate acyltransferase
MLSFLPGPVRGVLLFLLYAINTIFWSMVLFVLALFKLSIPVTGWRKLCSRAMDFIGTIWIFFNNCNTRLFNEIHWDVSGTDKLEPGRWYLVLANHQTWVDILVMQKIFFRKIPFLKFFLKKELFWVPVLGLAWWALDYPFLTRSSSTLKDIETTKKACAKFGKVPVSIMNFVEGTRFTTEKRNEQHSPYSHLLKPKAGGIALVLATMREQLHSILDVTIAYPEGAKSFWAFLCGEVSEIRVRVESLPIDKEVSGDYFQDREFRKKFRNWLNALWAEKDKTLAALLD